VSGSRITVANAGTYNIQFSAQLLADTGADDIFMWFTKNGNNITYSTTRLELENNQESVMTVNVLDTAAANDYYEIKWETTNGDAVLLFQNGSSNYPAIPSVIGTITQVR
jgi:hypothetical protein